MLASRRSSLPGFSNESPEIEYQENVHLRTSPFKTFHRQTRALRSIIYFLQRFADGRKKSTFLPSSRKAEKSSTRYRTRL